MKWIREVIVDIAVTIAIILAVFLPYHWLHIAVEIYTPLMLLLKLIVYFTGGFNQLVRKTQTHAPFWFMNLLYAINVIVLLSSHWWLTGAEWAAIWLLSYFTYVKTQKAKVTNSKKAKK